MTAPKMTEHRKLTSYMDRIETIREFISFLSDTGHRIGSYNVDGELVADFDTSDRAIYAYFGINMDALEAEREQAVRYVLEH